VLEKVENFIDPVGKKLVVILLTVGGTGNILDIV